MSDRPSIALADIPAGARKKLKLKRPRARGLSKDAVRSYAIRALAVLSGLSQRDRARILTHALKVNAV